MWVAVAAGRGKAGHEMGSRPSSGGGNFGPKLERVRSGPLDLLLLGEGTQQSSSKTGHMTVVPAHLHRVVAEVDDNAHPESWPVFLVSSSTRWPFFNMA